MAKQQIDMIKENNNQPAVWFLFFLLLPLSEHHTCEMKTKQNRQLIIIIMHPLLQLVLRVCKGAVAASGAAALLPEVSAHTGLVLAVGLRLQQRHQVTVSMHPLENMLVLL